MKKFIYTNINEYLNNQNLNFMDWFGDSKIVDENNKPLICYHGSDIKDIKEFDLLKVGYNSGNYGHYGYGVYFSEYKNEAKTYGSNIYECYLKVLNPFTGTKEQILELKNKDVIGIDDLINISIDFNSFKESFKDDDILYQFLLDIESEGLEIAWDNIRYKDINDAYKDKMNYISDIIEYTTLNKNSDDVPDYILTILKDLNINPEFIKGFPYEQSLHWITDLGNRSKEVTDVIIELGYDGVWYGSEIIIFHPNQIKSINNDGSFDLDDNNIYS